MDMAATARKSRNAVIDGWRGISVLLVIIAHFVGYRSREMFPEDALNFVGLPFGSKLLSITSSLGGLGVCFFFMISGYLITHLLLAEEERRNRVSLVAFYIRRIFRIFPAFYIYVIAIFLLDRSGLIITNNEAIVRSSVFICNYSEFSCSWWLAHTWSLAVEEQFYLVWPVIFAIASAWRLNVAIFLMFCLAGGTLFFAPLGSFTYIMIGVIVALSSEMRAQISKISQIWLWLLLGFLFALPAAPQVFSSWATALKPIIVAAVLFGSLFGPSTGLMQRLLQTPILTKIGLVSYSLYLWQQLSLAPALWGSGDTGADGLYSAGNLALGLIFIPIAVASYFFVEKPMISIGHRLSRHVLDRRFTEDRCAA